MNRIITLLFAVVLLGACAKKEYLDPIQLPDVVNNEIYRTDKFSENELFAASNTGIYLQFGANDYVEYTWTQIGISLTSSEMRLADVHYANGVLYISDSLLSVVITRNNKVVYQHAGIKKTASAISPEGQPLLVGLVGKDNSIDEYVLVIDKYENGTFNRVTTSIAYPVIPVIKQFGISFTSEGKLVIGTNPLVIIDDWTTTDGSFTRYTPMISNSYSRLVHPNKVDNYVFGYFDFVTPNKPASIIYRFDLNSKEVIAFDINSICNASNSSALNVKHLDWNQSISYTFLNTFSNYVEIGFPLFYIQKLDLATGSCESIEILSNELIQSCNSITDIGFVNNSNEITIGTKNGLFVYNLETKQCTKFIDQILQIF